MSGLFNKLRSSVGLRPFPEFEDMNEAVRGLSLLADDDCTAKNDFSGPKFRQFAECQGDMGSVLMELIGKYRELLTTKRLTIQDTIDLRRSIQPLQPSNERHRDDKKKLNDLKTAHEKSEKAHAAAEQKFNTLNQKSSGAPNTMKAQAEMETLKEKMDAAENELKEFQEQFKTKELEYKKRVVTILIEALCAWARDRKTTIEKYLPISEDLQAKVQELMTPSAGVDSLREELEQLRAEE